MSSLVALRRETGDDCSGIIAFECSHFHLLSVIERLLASLGQLRCTEGRLDALAATAVDDIAETDVHDGNTLP